MKTNQLFNQPYLYEYNDGNVTLYCVANNKIKTGWEVNKNWVIKKWHFNRTIEINKTAGENLKKSKRLYRI
jgi:hypothetical protein